MTTISASDRTFVEMRKFISIAYLGFILFMGMVQGGFFLDKMECSGSGSIALALNTRIACCEMDSDSGNHDGIGNPCCIHKSFFIENDLEPEHQIAKIDVPSGITSSTPFERLRVLTDRIWSPTLPIRPPPDLTQAELCVFRL